MLSSLQNIDLNTSTGLLKLAGAAILLILAVGRFGYFVSTIRGKLRAADLKSKLNESVFAGPFSDQDLTAAFSHYIEPDCSQTDPSNESDLRHVADLRESIYSAVDRFADQPGQRKYLMILADSGMGKSSFCLNYFAHRRKSKTGDSVALISLALPDAFGDIGLIRNPRDTILLLDALDADPEAIVRFGERLRELLSKTVRFKKVIITCRSQFYLDDQSIPVETGQHVITPRKVGEGGTYKIFHQYLMPLSLDQINNI